MSAGPDSTANVDDRIAPPGGDIAAVLLDRYRTVRAATGSICAPLSPEDCTVQSMPDASPTKWHLAHTSWFFETFVLEREVRGYRHFHPAFQVLFNSYYNTVGEQYPRPRRGMLTRPALENVMAYREHVDRHVVEHFMDEHVFTPSVRQVMEVGLNHEQQHQELILTDVKHLLSCNPLRPAYRDCPVAPDTDLKPLSWFQFPEGIQWIGHEGAGFAFDNERPRHRVFIDAFELSSRAITNGEFLAFMGDSGYERPDLWLSDGWSTLQSQGWKAPFYWEKRDGNWHVMTLSGLRAVRPEEPVCHVSYYEADAYARWAGARLPTEMEWEVAANGVALDGNFMERGQLQPAPCREVAEVPAQMFGDVWEWTQSSYSAYPGYTPPLGALGEYNGKFMCNQMVLRGGSCATPRSHIRPTYRSFFYPDLRWQFSGFRLARDAR